MSVRESHKNLSEVSDDLRKMDRTKMGFPIVADRAPVAADRYPVGTLWILDTSAANLYIRFPEPRGWRKITTAAP